MHGKPNEVAHRLEPFELIFDIQVYGRDLAGKAWVRGPHLVDAQKGPVLPASVVTNRYSINAYLGTTNVAGVLPS